jgi:hypothetical protein
MLTCTWFAHEVADALPDALAESFDAIFLGANDWFNKKVS